jgi:mono/diheme cytochrome c family protein
MVEIYRSKKGRSVSRSHLIVMAALSLLALVGCGQEEQDNEIENAILGDLPSIDTLAGTPAPFIPPLPDLDPAMVALGKKIYDQHCASCHGTNLEGEESWQQQNEDGSFRAPPHDESGHTWHHGDQLLVESIELGGQRFSASIGGTSPMPAFGQTLTDKEISAVLAFIKSSWPDDIRRIQWEMTVRSQPDSPG